MIVHDRFAKIIESYRADPESVFHTWFIHSEDRLKAFRSIRRGVEQVISDIHSGSFGNDFRGSSLEVVLNAITEQKQVFDGAAHAFYWKPKLRIPDIYENDANKRAFGQFLERCLQSSTEDQIIREIVRLNDLSIKGLGPAVANILYFLHPTLVPPSNTAMLRGFNLVFGTNARLGSWDSYLEMRDTVVRANEQFRPQLSKDLGAIAGLLFEVGCGKLVIEENAEMVLETERAKLATLRQKRQKELRDDQEQNQEHTKMQYLLAKIGVALGYDVAVASNDRNRTFDGKSLSQSCIPILPVIPVHDDVRSTIQLIDLLWLEKNANRIVCAFEIEKSTSIYSGILRLTDLALALPDHQTRLCLVVPNHREKEVVAQLLRPSILAANRGQASYFLFSDLVQHCDAICRFGTDHSILDKLVRTVGLGSA